MSHDDIRSAALSFTLDNIREAAEAKYGATEIEVGSRTVRLLNPLRLSKAKRNELMALQGKLDAEATDGEEPVDQEELLSGAIRLVCETSGQADCLLDEINGDLAVLAQVFETYGKGTQLGEASASDD